MPFNRLLRRLLAAVVVIIPALWISCELRVSALGYQHHIFIFADSLLWDDIGADVSAVFEKEIYTPHVENSFYTQWKPLDKLGGFKDRMNVFFAGVDGEDTPVNEYIRKSLPAEILDQMRRGELFYVYADDMFAKGQIGMFMYAEDRETFLKNLELLKDDMFRDFDRKYRTRLKKEIYDVGEQKDIEELLASNYGWKIRVQHDYFIANQNRDDRYVWLRRVQPDRWVSVWRIPGDSSLVNRESLIEIRNAMAGKYYEGDVVVEEDTYLQVTRLNEYPSSKLVGLWRNDSLVVGGPFRMYAVYDETQQAVYCIDIAVMAPGQLKKPYLDQLEVIANTFEIVKNSKNNKPDRSRSNE